MHWDRNSCSCLRLAYNQLSSSLANSQSFPHRAFLRHDIWLWSKWSVENKTTTRRLQIHHQRHKGRGNFLETGLLYDIRECPNQSNVGNMPSIVCTITIHGLVACVTVAMQTYPHLYCLMVCRIAGGEYSDIYRPV